MNGYNWTDAGTPQGRERLKELLDAGMEVVTAYAPHGTESPASTMMSYLHAGKYKIQGFWFGSLPDLETLESLFFLDPSPRLEPSELQWASEGRFLVAGDEWFIYVIDPAFGVYSVRFKATKNKTVMVNEKFKFPTGETEIAKAAIHEWRVNHLKSMTGA